MTNQSLRERFKIDDRNYSTASRIIRDALEDKAIKEDDPESNLGICQLHTDLGLVSYVMVM